MLWRESVLLAVLVVVAGCGPSAQEKYDAAARDLERAQARLDNLRPAYDAAREKAALAVCKEITGTTPEESAMTALTQLDDLAGQAVAVQVEDGKASDNPDAESRPIGDADQALDQLLAAHKSMREQQAVVTGPIAKTYETMKKIRTPGTEEAKRFEEVLAKMPEVKAYQRQEDRVERAKRAVEEAEAGLPDPSHDEAK